MDSSKILKVGEKLVSFSEKSLDNGKPIYDERVYDKVQYSVDTLASRFDIQKVEILKERFMDYLVRLYEAQYSWQLKFHTA